MRRTTDENAPVLEIHPTAVIHHTVLFFGCGTITVGRNSRIDAYTIISSGLEGIEIGRWVHIGSHVAIHGAGAKVKLGDGVSLSGRVSIYTSNDDFSSGVLIGPTFADKYRNVQNRPVLLELCVAVGVGSVILPGVTMFRGAACGAMCVVRRDVVAGDLVVGNPQVVFGKRDLMRLESLWREHSDEDLENLKEGIA
ncbi:MAG: acyltransferase [Planctomycetota bacterium]